MTGRFTLAALTAAALTTSSALAQSGAKPAQGPKPIEMKEAQPGLMRQATANVDSALKTAVGTSKGTVTSELVEKRGGQLVYVFGIRENGRTHHVIVDARTGVLVKPVAHANHSSRKTGKKDK